MQKLMCLIFMLFAGNAYAAFWDLHIEGDWNPNTNIPKLQSSMGQEGLAYRVSATGTKCLDSICDWVVNDLIYFDHSQQWRRINGRKEATGVCYVDTDRYTTLALAIAACPSNSTIQINASIYLTTDNVISGANVRVTCGAGVTLTLSAAGRITMSGDNSGIEGCKFVGPGATVAGIAAVFFKTGTGQYFRRNTVSEFGSSGNGVIFKANGSEFDASSNRIYNVGDQCIFANVSFKATYGFRAINNYCEGGIYAFPSETKIDNNYITIADNRIKIGTNGQAVFCVTVQRNGGNRPKGVVVANNTCEQAGAGHATLHNYGGYSLAWIDGLVVTGNTFNANGWRYDIAGYEIHSSSGVISGNYSEGAGNTGASAPGFICNTCFNMAFTGNTVNGFGTAITQGGFTVWPTAATADGTHIPANVSYTGNIVIMDTNAQGKGFDHQCVTGGALCPYFSWVGNTVIGGGHANSVGINILPLAANQAVNLLVGPNNITGTGIGVRGAANTTLCYIAGRNNATTPTSWGAGVVPACS